MLTVNLPLNCAHGLGIYKHLLHAYDKLYLHVQGMDSLWCMCEAY